MLVDGLAVALGGAVAARPVWLLFLELEDAAVVSVAEGAAAFADPLDCALLAAVVVGDFVLLPIVGKAVHIDLEGDALHLDLLAAQYANLLIQRAQLPIYYQLLRHLPLNPRIRLRTHVLQEGQDHRKRSQRSHSQRRFEQLIMRQHHLDLRRKIDDLGRYHWMRQRRHDRFLQLFDDLQVGFDSIHAEQHLLLLHLLQRRVQLDHVLPVPQQRLLADIHDPLHNDQSTRSMGAMSWFSPSLSSLILAILSNILLRYFWFSIFFSSSMIFFSVLKW